MRKKDFPALPVVLFILVVLSACTSTTVQKELAETYYNLGNAYLDLERWDDAETAYARAMDIDPGMYRAGYNMARIYIYNGNYNHAVDLLNGLLEEDPANIMVRESLAWCYMKMGQRSRGEEVYREILTEDPANCDVRYNLSLLLREEGNWEEVYSLLFECVELDKEDGEILFLLGRAERKTGKGKGLGWMEQAVRKDQKNTDLQVSLAEVYREEKMFVKAIEIYDSLAASEENKKGLYLFEKASILYTALDEKEEGFQALKASLDAGYGDTEALAGLLSLLGYEKTEDLPDKLSMLFREAELLDKLTSDLQKKPEESETVPPEPAEPPVEPPPKAESPEVNPPEVEPLPPE